MKNNLKKTSIILLIVLLTCLLTTGCRKKKPSEPQKQLTAKTTLTSTSKKKILYVDSYHEEYAWVQGITEGMLEPLNITMKGDGSLDLPAETPSASLGETWRLAAVPVGPVLPVPRLFAPASTTASSWHYPIDFSDLTF